MIKHPKRGYPYFTQDGKDRESGDDQYIANMDDGAVAGFKYFDLRETSKIRINIRGNASGMVYIRTAENQEPVAKLYFVSETVFTKEDLKESAGSPEEKENTKQ